MVVLSLDQRVVTSGNQGGHVEHTADIPSSAFGLAVAPFLASVIVHGCHTNQGCNFLAVDFAQLREFCQQSSGGHHSHAWRTIQYLCLLLPALLFPHELVNL